MKHLPPITVLTIPHVDQRYDTAGDYAELQHPHTPRWEVTVSQLSDWKYEALVALHELVEMVLTKAQGIDWAEIDEFDMTGEGKDSNDPGSLESAPYHKQHMAATYFEKVLAHWMGVDWDEYNTALDALEYDNERDSTLSEG